MKANYVEFQTRLSVRECAAIFRLAVEKRPLKLKIARFKFFTPAQPDNPFAVVDGTIKPEFEVGAEFSFPGPDPAMGSVVLSCLSKEGTTLVGLRSAGNVRGRLFTNRLTDHVLQKFVDADGSIQPEEYSGRL